MPPASANSIASLIWRRSKYLSRIRADLSERAQVARPLVVLGPEREVSCGDASRRRQYPLFHEALVRRDVVHLASPHVEENELRIGRSGNQPTACGDSVEPQLQRVRLQEFAVERRVRLEVHQRSL